MPEVNVFAHFLQGNPEEIPYECVEITHPSWPKSYRYVRNATDGLDVKHSPSDTETVRYEYYPVAITRPEANDDLDQSFDIAVGDLGEEIPPDIDRLRAYQAAGGKELPTLNYRVYISTNLTQPVETHLGLSLNNYTPSKEGSLFQFIRQGLNETGTGFNFNLADMPTLRGFL